MKFIAKVVITGFGLALGGALFKKVAPYVGLGEEKKSTPEDEAIRTGDGATDPNLHTSKPLPS